VPLVRAQQKWARCCRYRGVFCSALAEKLLQLISLTEQKESTGSWQKAHLVTENLRMPLTARCSCMRQVLGLLRVERWPYS
jgi:hypothetical protein